MENLRHTDNIQEKKDRLITPANIMTLSRPALALLVDKMLLAGEKPITPIIALMALSDMDGKVARFFDKNFPELNIGTTKIGAMGDQISDTLSILIVSSAASFAPRVSPMSKVAILSILGQEGIKSIWALKSSHNYTKLRKSTHNSSGDKLVLPTSKRGKKAMAEKLISLVCAIATNDTDNEFVKRGLELTSLSLAGMGIYHGEKAREEYNSQYKEMMSLLSTTGAEDSIEIFE